MEKGFDKMIETSQNFQDKTSDIIERLMNIARPEAVFGEPVTIGNQKIITASEISLGLGVGFGGGSEQSPSEIEEVNVENEEGRTEVGVGVGGGGGGGGFNRPVAVISLSPEGVSVKPILDVTKVALAFFAAMGTLFVSIGMAKRSVGKK